MGHTICPLKPRHKTHPSRSIHLGLIHLGARCHTARNTGSVRACGGLSPWIGDSAGQPLNIAGKKVGASVTPSLERACPPDIRDRAKQTALGTVVHELSEGRDEPTAARLKCIGELLMERGAWPTRPCDSEHTALSLARAYGGPDLESWLEAHAKAP